MIRPLNIEKVDSLEDYILCLGCLCVSVNTLIALQERALSIGIFDADEEEASKTLEYQARRLFSCADDLLRMTSNRTKLNFKKLATEAGLFKELKEEIPAPKKKKSTTNKK